MSFDPEHDTPGASSPHTPKKLGADPGIWRFATAPPASRRSVRRHVRRQRHPRSGRTITHNLRTAVIGPGGRVVSVHDGSDWTAAQVLDDLARMPMTPRVTSRRASGG